MEALKTYLKDIRHIPLLTAEQEITLSKKIKKGDEHARKSMIRGQPSPCNQHCQTLYAPGDAVSGFNRGRQPRIDESSGKI